MKIILIVLISTFYFLNGQVNDYCKSYDVLFDLKLNNIKGDWYPLYVSSNVATIYDCFNFKVNIVNVENIDNLEIDYMNLLDNTSNNIKFKSTEHSNSFKPIDQQNFALLTVVDTDYSSYMTVLVCHPMDQGKIYQAIILGRASALSEDVVIRIKQILLSRFGNFDWVQLRAGDQCKI